MRSSISASLGSIALTALALPMLPSCNRGEQNAGVDSSICPEKQQKCSQAEASQMQDLFVQNFESRQCIKAREKISEELRAHSATLREFAVRGMSLVEGITLTMSSQELQSFSERLQRFNEGEGDLLVASTSELAQLALRIDDVDATSADSIFTSFAMHDAENLVDGSEPARFYKLVHEWAKAPAYYGPGESADSVRYAANALWSLSSDLEGFSRQISGALERGDLDEARLRIIEVRRSILSASLDRLADHIYFEAVYISEKPGDRHFAGTNRVAPRPKIENGFGAFLIDGLDASAAREQEYFLRIELSRNL
ncbi:MAG: hypothetical protein K1X79_06215 [Oligoflexia bacterium]|nr:hypothetical protein [Oligoflexia bacterium]